MRGYGRVMKPGTPFGDDVFLKYDIALPTSQQMPRMHTVTALTHSVVICLPAGVIFR